MMSRFLTLVIVIVGSYWIFCSIREARVSHKANELKASLCSVGKEYSRDDIIRAFLVKFPKADVYEGKGYDRSVTIIYDSKQTFISPFTRGTVLLIGTRTSGEKLNVTDITYSAQEEGHRKRPDRVYLRNQPLP